MVVQEDTVFVSGMDSAFTEEDIAQHFGAIGVIKVSCKQLFYLFVPVFISMRVALCV